MDISVSTSPVPLLWFLPRQQSQPRVHCNPSAVNPRVHTFTPFTQAGDETSSEEEDDEDDEPKKKKRVRAVHRTSDIAMALLSFDNLFYVSSFVLRCKITTFASAIASIMVLPTPTPAFGHTHAPHTPTSLWHRNVYGCSVCHSSWKNWSKKSSKQLRKTRKQKRCGNWMNTQITVVHTLNVWCAVVRKWIFATEKSFWITDVKPARYVHNTTWCAVTMCSDEFWDIGINVSVDFWSFYFFYRSCQHWKQRKNS